MMMFLEPAGSQASKARFGPRARCADLLQHERPSRHGVADDRGPSGGAPVHVINSSVVASPFVFALPYNVPPPDCFSCHIVATSNLYGVYFRVRTQAKMSRSSESHCAGQLVSRRRVLSMPYAYAYCWRLGLISTLRGQFPDPVTIASSDYTDITSER